MEIWNGVPFLSPLWARGPCAVWLHHVHGPMWEMTLPPRLARAGRFFEERVAPNFYRSTPIVTLSESSKRELVEEMGLPGHNITVVPPGVDQRFSPGLGRTRNPHVVAVARLVPVKDFSRLIRIMVAVRRRVPDAYLSIVGEGYEREMLEEHIDRVGAHDYIRLLGHLDDDDVTDLYRSAWVVASTSIREGWGMTLTEAAACATPCVATRIAGHVDATVEGEAGLLGDTDDELTDALVAVLTDDELRERLAKGALERARELTWERAAVDSFAVLAEDAGRRARP
ncbi:MAG: glycosyltransferase family 4 protein [Microthrixaceae bacterium]